MSTTNKVINDSYSLLIDLNPKDILSKFLSRLVMCDTIIIPTDNMDRLSILLELFGNKTLKRLIKDNSLKFVYLPEIARLTIPLKDIGDNTNIRELEWEKDKPECVLEKKIKKFTSPKKDLKLFDLVLDNTSFASYKDVYSVLGELHSSNRSDSKLYSLLLDDGDKLQNIIEGSQIVVDGMSISVNIPDKRLSNTCRKYFRGRAPNRGLRALLRLLYFGVHEIEWQIFFGSYSTPSSLLIDSNLYKGYHHIVSRSFDEVVNPGRYAIFNQLFQLNNIPDLEMLFEKDVLSINEIYEIRKKAERLRDWIKTVSKEITNKNEQESIIIRKYVEKLSETPWHKTKWFTDLRFCATVGIGLVLDSLVQPGISVAAAAIDHWMISKILKGWTPNTFFDEIKKSIE